MIVVMLCCYVRRYVQVCDGMLRNALYNGCMNVAWALFWVGSRRNFVCFLCQVAVAGDDRYLLCAAVAAGVVLVPILCFATSCCSCVRSSMSFLNPCLQIALEWLHDCCHALLLCAWIRAGLRRDAAKRIVMAA